VSTIPLSYQPPYDWAAMLGWLAPRSTPGVEAVTDGCYSRSVRLGEHRGTVAVRADLDAPILRVELSPSLTPAHEPLIARLRQLFDLDAEPSIIREHFARDSWLGPLVERRPGLRVPGAMDGFELAVRAVLGQQVSVRGASTLAGRLAALLGEPLAPDLMTEGVGRLPVTAARMAEATEARVAGIGIPLARARTLVALARAVAGGGLDLTPGAEVERTRFALMELPGVGDWTAEYVLMRAVRWPDAFPAGDLGLRKAAGGIGAAELRRRAERWRPWRAYAAAHLWRTLADSADPA
jgi:AraC family transcriptional regulator of adaptative response / DNA-3-methyladenine glycosylase II